VPRRPAQKAIDFVTTPNFAELGLAEPLLRALSDAEYTHPTPIQAKSIPALLEGRDLLGLAETGTGKTAAFVLPLLHRLTAEGGRPQPGAPRALILAPTRELAIQIGESIHAYGRHVRISHTVIFGGVGQRPQVTAIARGVDILVATPGRLLDLIDQRHLRLDKIRTFILDEADRMLDMGFVRDVRRILKLVPAERHTLLFSATMPQDIAQLAADMLKDPVRVEIARAGKTVDRIDQKVIFISAGAKREALARLLQDPAMRRVIVFTRTKRGADRVSKAIEHIGIGVHAIHGNKSQGQRQSALDSFRKGFTRVLVATDIAARGIDIDEITHVINYELPNIPESYVHRIGRTARAGAEGVAIALCAPDEREYLRDIERLTGTRLSVVSAAGFIEGPAISEAPGEPAEEEGARHNGASRPPRDRAPRDGAPRRERSRHEARPHREERTGAPRRSGAPHGGRNGPRHGDRPNRDGDAPRDGARHADRQHGHAPRHGDARRGNDAPHDGARHSERPNGHGHAPRDRDARRAGDEPRNGARHGERSNGHGHAPRDRDARRTGDAPRSHPRHGDRPHGNGHASRSGEGRHAGGAARDSGRHGERSNGNGRPQRNADTRHAGDAQRNLAPGKDAPQPWRNWTRGSGVHDEETRRDRSPARPPHKRNRDRQRDGGQGRGRAAPRAER